MNKFVLFLLIGLCLVPFVTAKVSSWDWRYQSMTWQERTLQDAVSAFTQTTDYSNVLAKNSLMNYYVNPHEDKITLERVCSNFSYPVNSTIFVELNYTVNGSVLYNMTNFTNTTYLIETECTAANITNSASSYIPASNGTTRLANVNMVYYSPFKRVVFPNYRSNQFKNVTPKIDENQAKRYAMEQLQKLNTPRILSYEQGTKYCRKARVITYDNGEIGQYYYGNCPIQGASYNMTPTWVNNKYYDSYAFVVAGYKAQTDLLWEKMKKAQQK